MRVKICGITNIEDALNAIEFGADALGFVFFKESPRYITPENAREIISQLPPFVERVGLFVNESVENINHIVNYTNISLSQIHFEPKNIDFYKNLTSKHIKVIRASNINDLALYSDEYRIVDAFVDCFGGSGKRVPIEWFDNIDCSKIILAGGLTIHNIEDIKRYDFFGVDISSGVEISKGKKDREKMQKFIELAK
jgi:phosphoribosylanthranilate isomerase